MLDLNIDAGSSADTASCVDETDQLAVNAAVDADSPTSSTTCRNSSVSALNFSILHGNAIRIEDDVSNCAFNNIIELQLFPVDASSSSPAAARAEYWSNSLAAPEASCGGAVQHHPPAKKSRRGPRSRSSQFRGVTFYRRTGRWESHIWDCGKQVYLGGFDTAHAAAIAYDHAAVKFRGVGADINFNISDYEEDMKQMKNLTKEEFIQVLRCKSNGLSRGSSKYRGVTLHGMGQILQEKATTIYNLRQPLTNIEAHNYKIIETNRSTMFGGSIQNLDLNLGISSASDGLWKNHTISNLHFPYASSESPYVKGVEIKNSAASSKGKMITTKYAPTRGGIYSGFSLDRKERASETNGEAISSSGIPNREWKVQNHAVINSVPVLYSAASSGFSSATTPR